VPDIHINILCRGAGFCIDHVYGEREGNAIAVFGYVSSDKWVRDVEWAFGGFFGEDAVDFAGAGAARGVKVEGLGGGEMVGGVGEDEGGCGDKEREEE
jgi:hypothetical protein